MPAHVPSLSSRYSTWTRLMLLTAGTLASHNGLAQSAAEERSPPFQIGASLGFTHESNVLRAPSRRADNGFSSTLFGGVDQRLGRHHLSLSASVSENRYQEVSSLNNTSYGLNTRLDWNTAGKLLGDFRYGLSQNLANPSLAGLPSTDQRNSEKTQLLAAHLNYLANSRMRLQAGLQHRQLAYSDAAYASRENTQNTVTIGGSYGLAEFTNLGLALRTTHIDTPRFTPSQADTSHRKDIDFTLQWRPGGFSTLNARLSLGDENHSLATHADFSGLTGQITWDYQASGRWRLITSLIRDTGTEARFADFVGGATPPALEAYRLTHTARALATYSMSAKVNLNLSGSYTRGSLVSSPALSGMDRVKVMSFGAQYNPQRNLTLGCEVGRESRSTDSVLSNSYIAYTGGCFGRIALG